MTALTAFVTSFLWVARAADTDIVPDTLQRGVELKELLVKPTKQKYSKKNNPAVDFVERLRATSSINSTSNHEFYNYDRYGRLTVALCPFDSSKIARGSLDFLKEHTDSSPLSNTPILPISVKEKSSKVYTLDHGATRKEIVEALNRNGLDEMVNQEGIERVLEDVLREIDLYEGDVPLLNNHFVSPLSKLGPDFYMYFLSDTITASDGSRWIELSFTPRVNTTYGFLGRLYVAEGDTTMFVKRATMTFPSHININYIDRILIEQTYERAPDGTRLKTMDDLQAELKFIPGVPGVYARRLSKFSNHSFEEPDTLLAQRINEIVGETITNSDALLLGQSEGYWETVRETDMSRPQKNVRGLMSNLRNLKGYRYLEKGIKIIGTGYIPTHADFNKSRFDFGPLFNMVSNNSLEGWRLQVGGMTTYNLSKRWFLNGFVAYGLRDHRWKEKISVEYSFIEKQGFHKNFPVQSLEAGYSNDVYYLGQKLNAYGMLFQSIQRDTKSLIAYKRQGWLTYTHERRNNFSWTLTGNYSRVESTRLIDFERADGSHFNHYNVLEGATSVRWAPGEKLYETRMHRKTINDDNWVLQLSVGGGRIYAPWTHFNKITIDLNVKKKFWFSAFGNIYFDISGGKVFGTVPYTELATLPVNTSYLIVDGSFTLARPMEFIGDLYGKWDVTYNGMGVLFSRLPLIKKLKIREVVGLRGWWSSLQKKNNPLYNHSLYALPYDSEVIKMPRPYMEFYAGIDNILTIMRVDWVYRVNYRNLPGIDKWGVRLAIHFSF